MINCKNLFKVMTPYKVAKILNIPISTVYSWKRFNKIPVWREGAILTACSRLGIDISDCEVKNA